MKVVRSYVSRLMLGSILALVSSWSSPANAAAQPPRPARQEGAPPTPDVGEPAPLSEDLRFGVVGGLAFPRPLAIEGLVKVARTLGFGLEYSVLPTMTISGVETSFWALAGDARVFPFKNGFFLGAAVGYQHLGAQTSVSVGSLGTIPESVAVDTWFVNPRIGWLTTWSSGFTLGIDAGLQIPLSAAVSSTLPSQLPASQSVSTVAMSLGNSVLPTVDLLRVGFLF